MKSSQFHRPVGNSVCSHTARSNNHVEDPHGDHVTAAGSRTVRANRRSVRSLIARRGKHRLFFCTACWIANKSSQVLPTVPLPSEQSARSERFIRQRAFCPGDAMHRCGHRADRWVPVLLFKHTRLAEAQRVRLISVSLEGVLKAAIKTM